MRICGCCGIPKEESEYYQRKDGKINRWCKECEGRKAHERHHVIHPEGFIPKHLENLERCKQRYTEMVGSHYGRLTVTGYFLLRQQHPSGKISPEHKFTILCDCGKEKTNVDARKVWQGKTTSCGKCKGLFNGRPMEYRIKSGYGYWRVYTPDHPRANRRDGRVFEHILVWEKANGRSLPEGWCIHHINGIKTDNRPENLVALLIKKHDLLIPIQQEKIRGLEERLNQNWERIVGSQEHPVFITGRGSKVLTASWAVWGDV